MMRTAAFTIISPNYRHFARVLMASCAQHHPDWERFVLECGGASPLSPPRGERVRVWGASLPNAEERPLTPALSPRGGEREETTVPLSVLSLPYEKQFTFRYTLLELNTAVKPWMFEHLFARGYDRVIYFDPDIRIYSPLEELETNAFLILTPHLTSSRGNDDHHPSERSILLAGTYNLGFLAATRHESLARFLKWWQEKLEYQCIVDTARGLFVDQKWIDLAPGLFPDVAILRHEGYNVAYWNLAQRRINDPPLRFFHFSGFDPAIPDAVSKNDPRQRVAATGDAAKLFEDYGAALRAAGAKSFRNAPYSYGFFADGTRVSDAARIAYRNSPELQAACGEDPFAHPELFRGMQDRKRNKLAAKVAVRSYQLLSRVRPLVTLLPKDLRTRTREFLLGRKERTSATIETASELPEGLNVVGYLTRDTGVGESARLCLNACSEAGLATHAIDIDSSVHQALYRASIFHVNADRMLIVRNQIPQIFDASAYNIGCWHWELPELPDAWITAAEPLDEIWAPSAFVQSAISRKVTIPVAHMPHGIEVTNIEACTPEELGVARGRFTFLLMFDFDSIMERKNPRAAIEAFRRAFPNESNAALLIKTTGAERHREEYESLRAIPGVVVTDRTLPRSRVNGLIDACDAMISLHRSEGFGLILAEAMDLGKPVIATGWSGNMDFMNAGNSCPVAYELVTLDRNHGPYAAGQQWAEPDVDHAAHLMRRIVDDDAFRAQIGARARQTIRSQFSPEAAGLRYRRRLRSVGVLAG